MEGRQRGMGEYRECRTLVGAGNGSIATRSAKIITLAHKRGFFADAMLGRLARWLRVMGYDCAYENRIDDRVLVERAVSEDRVILTRDTLLGERKAAQGRVFFVKGNTIEEQVRGVREAFTIDSNCFLTRCLRCNLKLQEAQKESVKAVVPAYVFETQAYFSRCPGCGRIYWNGTHKDGMRVEVERLLKG